MARFTFLSFIINYRKQNQKTKIGQNEPYGI